MICFFFTHQFYQVREKSALIFSVLDEEGTPVIHGKGQSEMIHSFRGSSLTEGPVMGQIHTLSLIWLMCYWSSKEAPVIL